MTKHIKKTKKYKKPNEGIKNIKNKFFKNN